jgi:hypothetical protein
VERGQDAVPREVAQALRGRFVFFESIAGESLAARESEEHFGGFVIAEPRRLVDDSTWFLASRRCDASSAFSARDRS